VAFCRTEKEGRKSDSGLCPEAMTKNTVQEFHIQQNSRKKYPLKFPTFEIAILLKYYMDYRIENHNPI
jgi:hypothetical protein